MLSPAENADTLHQRSDVVREKSNHDNAVPPNVPFIVRFSSYISEQA